MIYVKTLRGEMVPLEQDWAEQASTEAERHLAACWEWHRDDEEDAAEGPNPAVGAFCGGTDCVHTCEVREVLTASMPFIIAGLQRDGFEVAVEVLGIDIFTDKESTDG